MASANVGDEKSRLMKIFPEEVWLQIMMKVRDARAYIMISSASPHLRPLMFVSRAIALFPEVMALLVENQHEAQQGLDWVLKNRSVCHPWKTCVNKLVAEQQFFFMGDGEQVLSNMNGLTLKRHPIIGRILKFSKADQFHAFMMDLKFTHEKYGANPFLEKKVELWISDIRGSPELYYAECLQFLRIHGHHLLYCVVSYQFINPTELQGFLSERLGAILEQMPNLKAVHFHRINHGILTEVAFASFPKLPNLDFIHLSDMPHAVLKKLLQQSPIVKNVDALHYSGAPQLVFEQLSELRAVAFNVMNISDVEYLEKAQIPSGVERIWLEMGGLIVPARVERIFEILQHSSLGNLIDLHVSLPRNQNIRDTCAKLRLPALKSLHLEMRTPQRLHFLLPLQDTLAELRLGVEQEDMAMNGRIERDIFGNSDENGYLLRVYQFLEEPIRSNIWHLFSALQILEVRVLRTGKYYYCTKKQWEAGVVKARKEWCRCTAGRSFYFL